MNKEIFNITSFVKFSGYTPEVEGELKLIEAVYKNFDRWNNSEEFGCLFFKHGGMKAMNRLYTVLVEVENIMDRIKSDKNELEKMAVLYGIMHYDC